MILVPFTGIDNGTIDQRTRGSFDKGRHETQFQIVPFLKLIEKFLSKFDNITRTKKGCSLLLLPLSLLPHIDFIKGC